MMNRYQFVVKDLEALSGASVVTALRTLLLNESIMIVGRDVQGSGIKPLTQLLARPKIVAKHELLAAVAAVMQIDWAFIFTFAVDESPMRIAKLSNEDLLAASKLTVRLADDTYMYFYSDDFAPIDRLIKAGYEGILGWKELSLLEVLY